MLLRQRKWKHGKAVQIVLEICNKNLVEEQKLCEKYVEALASITKMQGLVGSRKNSAA